MLTKKILIGMLASLFYLSLAGVVVAGNNEKPSDFSGDQVISTYMDKHGNEFSYSPMVESSQITAVSPVYVNDEDIELGYSPMEESSQISALSPVYVNNEDIEFDYSPRVDGNEVDFEGTAKPILVCAASLIDTLPQNQADYCRRMLGI
jgi:hypothetical protein